MSIHLLLGLSIWRVKKRVLRVFFVGCVLDLYGVVLENG